MRRQKNIAAQEGSTTVLEKLLEDISFEAPEKKNGKLPIDREYVRPNFNLLILLAMKT